MRFPTSYFYLKTRPVSYKAYIISSSLANARSALLKVFLANRFKTLPGSLHRISEVGFYFQVSSQPLAVHVMHRWLVEDVSVTEMAMEGRTVVNVDKLTLWCLENSRETLGCEKYVLLMHVRCIVGKCKMYCCWTR